MNKLILGDCAKVLKDIPDNSIESMVTDPPAGISFMGKDWDDNKGGRDAWVAWLASIMRECLRILKPGAHGLVWALPRTSHWTGLALEQAGFEVRDVITHLFGSGFPKSLNISKAIDKAAGAEPATDAAKQWQGWGTALKPACEMWFLVRKPISEKTIAANVLKYETGTLNIDKTRIAINPNDKNSRPNGSIPLGGKTSMGGRNPECDGNFAKGRFPSNLVLSHSPYCTDDQCHIECPVKMLDGQSGTLVSKYGKQKIQHDGGASRFFYCAKVSTSERNIGCDDFIGIRSHARPNSPYLTGTFPDHDGRVRIGNHHPTVKPIKLMRYFCRLITPSNGTILDPFMGSGSTGCAAIQEGFKFIGIEREKEYFEIATNRIKAYE